LCGTQSPAARGDRLVPRSGRIRIAALAGNELARSQFAHTAAREAQPAGRLRSLQRARQGSEIAVVMLGSITGGIWEPTDQLDWTN
jgi:hypothetical protein